jgi:two-component system chemotaxis response regulator CheB
MTVELVVIGTSLGGLSALEVVLAELSPELRVPIAVVQHRRADGRNTLSKVLQSHSGLRVTEPDDKDPIEPGNVYMAPADYHLLVTRGSFALSTEPRVHYARPSIDVLFESAAYAYGAGLVGVILTGANSDGAEGLACVKAHGGFTIVESPSTAECAAMPKAAIAASAVDRILPLAKIAALLARYCATGEGDSGPGGAPEP